MEARAGTHIPRQPPRINPPGSAARLPYFVDNWAKVCSNKFILRIVDEGYILQFITIPYHLISFLDLCLHPLKLSVTQKFVSFFLMVQFSLFPLMLALSFPISFLFLRKP